MINVTLDRITFNTKLDQESKISVLPAPYGTKLNLLCAPMMREGRAILIGQRESTRGVALVGM